MKQNPLILEIKGNSLDDGPGIRTVVFFKGCPLDCIWCHNPESKSRHSEISFDKTVCIACDTCLEYCQRDALKREHPFFIDRNKCDLCFECSEQCPSEALSQVGAELSVEEILPTILQDIPFYKTSGGGLTLSGGEPLMFIEFASSLLRAVKQSNIHTLVETCGLFSFNAFMENIAPYCGQLYFDIKLFNSETHKQYCGITNKLILENLTRLAQLPISDSVNFLPRIPLVPGITDTQQNLTEIAVFLSENQLRKVSLLDYNPLWGKKCNKIGKSINYPSGDGLESWMKPEQVELSKSIFTSYGIEVV